MGTLQPTEISRILAALDAAPLAALACTPDQRVVWANHRMAEALGMEGSVLVGKTAAELTPHIHLGAMETGDLVRLRHRASQGRRVFACTRAMLAVGDGPPLSLYYLVEVTEAEALRGECQQLTARLEAVETRDPVTGLYNRRGLTEILEAQVSRSRRYGNALSVVGLELVAEADSAPATLRAVGRLLRDQLRWVDVVGRWDGAAFVLLLPETRASDALPLARRLVGRVAALTPAGRWRARCGITQHRHGDDVATMLRRLDEALGRAAADGADVATL